MFCVVTGLSLRRNAVRAPSGRNSSGPHGSARGDEFIHCRGAHLEWAGHVLCSIPHSSGEPARVTLVNSEVTEIMEIALIRILIEAMPRWLALLLVGVSYILKRRAVLQLENLTLRHQIGELRRSAKKLLSLQTVDQLLWVWLSRISSNWRSSLIIVKPETSLLSHLLSTALCGSAPDDLRTVRPALAMKERR